MERMKRWFLWGLSLLVLSVPAFSGAQEQASTIDPKADKLLRQMSDYLNTLDQFTISVENSLDSVLLSGQKLQLGRAIDVIVKRPDRLRVNVDGDRTSRELYYDGKSITLFSKDVNYYGMLEAPSNVEAAMDHAEESVGLVAPMADLISRNCYDILAEDILSGFYVGLSNVRGVQCHHLAFRAEETDWQIWIENSKTPFPRKFVITSKWVTGAPQFTGIMDRWDVSPKLEEGLFIFVPPKEARQIGFLAPEN